MSRPSASALSHLRGCRPTPSFRAPEAPNWLPGPRRNGGEGEYKRYLPPAGVALALSAGESRGRPGGPASAHRVAETIARIRLQPTRTFNSLILFFYAFLSLSLLSYFLFVFLYLTHMCVRIITRFASQPPPPCRSLRSSANYN